MIIVLKLLDPDDSRARILCISRSPFPHDPINPMQNIQGSGDRITHENHGLIAGRRTLERSLPVRILWHRHPM
jgi:hypothetical protein